MSIYVALHVNTSQQLPPRPTSDSRSFPDFVLLEVSELLLRDTYTSHTDNGVSFCSLSCRAIRCSYLAFSEIVLCILFYFVLPDAIKFTILNILSECVYHKTNGLTGYGPTVP